MVEVYYYLPVQHADNVIDCGLKLSDWFDKEVRIGGDLKKCLSALLNPKDDLEKYRSSEYKCVKLELSPNYCYAADKALFVAGHNYPQVMELYEKSIIPVKDYRFGSYRLPECLVTSTVIAGHISPLDKRLDSPVLFDNSEELYINNIIEAYKEEHDDFNHCLLYFFYCRLAEIGKVDKIEDNRNRIAVFTDKQSGSVTTIRIPDVWEYK
ncbi:MAG: hypothetical protein N2489_00560 [Clostridia bacterium]|nr:hypothetical protein [Clostridia bacterium]